MSAFPPVHLVTYATSKYLHRQILLGLSGRLNRVVNTVTAWCPKKLLAAGFNEQVKDLELNERGSGYWSWKPFIIQSRLNEVPEGDIVFYCDVGRRYPFTLLDQPITPFIEWMDSMGQEMIPGVENTWDGPVSHWTKREALVFKGMDRQEIYDSTIIQAGFSFWRSGLKSRKIVSQWMDLCSRRNLISDDASGCGLIELPEFREHRHDQSLLTLLCLQEGLKGLRFTESRPAFESGNPSEVSKYKFGSRKRPIAGTLLDLILASPIQALELKIRGRIKFS